MASMIRSALRSSSAGSPAGVIAPPARNAGPTWRSIQSSRDAAVSSTAASRSGSRSHTSTS